MKYIKKNGGAIIYLQQEGRGIGIANKVAAYALQDEGMDTVDANTHLGFPEDARQYGVVPSILTSMGIDSIKLITNNPRKIKKLKSLGVDVVDTIPMVIESTNDHNRKYLQTKQDRMNHKNFGELLSLNTQNPDDDISTLVAETVTMIQFETEKKIRVTGGGIVGPPAVATDEDSEQAGVTASEDGYCFGRKSVEDAIAAVRVELNKIKSTITQYTLEYEVQLKKVNETLWKIEDRLREKEKLKEFDEEFIQLARNVYITNDQRAEIKKKINELCNSSYREIKVY